MRYETDQSTSYETFSDFELSRLLQEGNHKAYKEIYERYWMTLYRHARKMLQNEEEARDVVQDIFVMLWCKHADLDLTVSLSSFLYAAVRNRILNIFKRSKIQETHLASLKDFKGEGSVEADSLVREHELAAIIEKEIAALPSRMREVFELKRKSNYSYKEIAAKMEISELTVKTQMNKAIKTFKIRLGSLLSFFIFL